MCSQCFSQQFRFSPADWPFSESCRVLQVWIPELMNNSVFNSTDKDEQIDALLKERERCQNELQKLKDIVGFTSNQIKSGELRTRDSYLPDTGPLYDTVRELQHFMFKKAADWTTLSQKIQEEDPVVPDHDVASGEDVLLEQGGHIWKCTQAREMRVCPNSTSLASVYCLASLSSSG